VKLSHSSFAGPNLTKGGVDVLDELRKEHGINLCKLQRDCSLPASSSGKEQQENVCWQLTAPWRPQMREEFNAIHHLLKRHSTRTKSGVRCGMPGINDGSRLSLSWLSKEADEGEEMARREKGGS
jgi:hypothetical protein